MRFIKKFESENTIYQVGDYVKIDTKIENSMRNYNL